MDDELYLRCECHSPEHTLCFVYDEDQNEIYTEVYLNQYHNFFKRVWIAIKYIFVYKSRYGHWDCFILKKKDANSLRNLLDRLEE